MQKVSFLNRHLVETEENYFEHFLFAFAISMWILLTGFILMCHAFFPFLFRVTASSSIRKVSEVMQKRREVLMERIEAQAKRAQEADKESEIPTQE